MRAHGLYFESLYCAWFAWNEWGVQAHALCWVSLWECWLRMQLEIFANNTLHFTLSRFNPDLLRDEPLDKVRAVIAEAQRIHGL